MTGAFDDIAAGESPALSHWLMRAVRRWPDGCALRWSDGEMSYTALAHEVVQLAERIGRAGLQPGDRIGIAATRSPGTIVAILAAIHADVAYVPLDLAYPADRLRFMLDESRPRAVVGETSALEVVLGPLPSLDSPAAAEPSPFAAADDLRYVLFTSGSTGRPKGVAMGERPLRHLIAWHAAHPRLGTAARTLQFAPLSFDVHFQEILSTVACGGCLVLLTEAQRRDPQLLAQSLCQHRLERLFLPYVALQMLADACAGHPHPPLRDVISAGEQLQITPAIRNFFKKLPNSVLHNHYGPTETHVVTAYELDGDPGRWPVIPPIGQALPHVHIRLRALDDGDTDEGELLLGGDTLAHGYLGQAELSAERFCVQQDAPGERWYRTGDRVQRSADGTLVYLGRCDQQLKIDGYRIEPGEIEVALLAHPQLKDAAVGAVELAGAGRQLMAWIVASPATAQADLDTLEQRLRADLRERLPDYMQPVRYQRLDQLPLTPSGKIDRRALPLPLIDETTSATAPLAPHAQRNLVGELWRELLGQPTLSDRANLFEAGARSLLVLRFLARLQQHGIRRLSVADVYDHPTIAGQAMLFESASPRANPRIRPDGDNDAIAIVGMATRTPGGDSVDEFWSNLLDGREGIRHFAADELDPSVPMDLRQRPNFVAARGVLAAADRFDAEFFGIPAREATLIDPQQRVLLELAWTALEHAGVDPLDADTCIGVYAGTANNSYLGALRAAQPELISQSGEFVAMLASEKDYVATRIAHRLNLNGPAVSVHTACSTGLVAVAQAAQALLAGQCDVALAGGATVIVPEAGGYLHLEGGMESADGHCRPFDADASGTVFSSGAGLVVLKRLADAQADGDTVYALIRGIGLNNDGGEKASFTAPSVRGQSAAIRMALDHAQVRASQLGYVEAHGTGTALGDPIEVAALTRAFEHDSAGHGYCVLGSLKGNIGHTIAAAGVLGLIKASLSLHHQIIPPTLHFRRPNPQIDFGATPFRVSAQAVPWPRTEVPRYAAVSSFGVGGTNAHLVLQEAPPTRPLAQPAHGVELLPLSARTPEAALRRAQDLANWLELHPEQNLASVAASLIRGRADLPHRLSVAARGSADAAVALRALRSATPALEGPRLVYLYPGQGSQHPGMATGLYHEIVAFRAALDAALGACEPHVDVDLRRLLIDCAIDDGDAAALLNQTRYAQPALFCVSYALTAWLDSLGLVPASLIGHSIGEYAAACRAGVLSLADAATAVCARGTAMHAQPGGAMLAVRATAESVSAWLDGDLEIAAVNAPESTVVAGSVAAITALAERLGNASIGCKRLQVSHAFHSAHMDAALPAVAQTLLRLTLQAPGIPLYSCVSGQHLRADEAVDPDYWARQVRACVQFGPAISAELQHADTVFVEVGPAQALSALLRSQRDAQGRPARCIPLLGRADQASDAPWHALNALGAVWRAGVPLRWPLPRNAARASLPTYPFADTRFWFRRPAAPAATIQSPLQSHDAVAVASAEESRVSDRRPLIEQEVLRLLSNVSGMSSAEINRDQGLIEQGFDSLSLTQASLELERVFGIKLRLRRLMEDLDRVSRLVAFFHSELPPERFAPASTTPVPLPAAPASVVHATTAASAAPLLAGNPLVELIQQQTALMAQHLALLSGQTAAPAKAVATASVSALPTVAGTAAAPAETTPAETTPNLREAPFGASARITVKPQSELSPAQRAWLADFTERYLSRSGKSRAFSQQHRARMADPRVVTGFNPLWKDLVYPIVVQRSDGARMWDLDGNAYIDLLSAFGANLLGYQVPSVRAAMQAQLEAGIEVGPQHPLAAEVAELLCEMTGMARVGFCNTGSEAVMGAMRIARTVTGRKTIAIFTNSYHGIFDEVIVRGTRQLRSISAAPGILASAVENVLVLDYASDDSLRVLRERGHELAAIMIEPVQNKYPTLQPRQFVQQLREICDTAGCALIFDEVVTGFRLAPAGAQQFYGVRADICTYGKIIGGGLPFAAIAGAAHWLDALDGGHWQYGDDSYPEAGVTYFAGTFVRHPLALAAAQATLQYLKQRGQAFYDDLNARTQRLVDRLNAAFIARNAPVKAVHCASLWRLIWDDEQKYVSLFYYLARYHGLHLYEQFGHFVTEAMGEAEITRIADVFIESLGTLMARGFITRRDGLPPPDGTPGDEPGADTQGPLTTGQTERWLAASYAADALRALNETLCLSLQGDINLPALEQALHDAMTRHDAFRLGFDASEPLQRVDRRITPRFKAIDLRAQADPQAALERYCHEAGQHRFQLDAAPLIELSLLQLSSNRVAIHLVASHLVFDGWASSVLLRELAQAYRARCQGQAPQFPAAQSPCVFASDEQSRMAGPQGEESLRYWRRQFCDVPPALNLGDRSPPQRREFTADTRKTPIDGELYRALQQLARQQRATLFQLLLSAVATMIRRLSTQNDFVLSVPFASQSLGRYEALIGDGVLDLPIRLRCADASDVLALLPQVRAQLMDALEHPLITQGTLARALGLPSHGDRPPLTGVFFNLNPRIDLSQFAPLAAEIHETRKPGLLSELIFNFYETADTLTLDLHYSTEFFSPQRADELVNALRDVLTELTGVPVATVAPAAVHDDRDARTIAQWNATQVAYESPLRLGDLLQRGASQHAASTALRFEGRSVTYAELDRLAWAIAHRLRERGVGPGVLVGVCLERSVELVAALLGVIYSGGAYVPLDPSYPPERLQGMCEDASLGVIVTRGLEHKRAGDAFPAEAWLLFLDTAPELDEHQAIGAEALVGSADDMAYVIFTSGSTGRPKGAANAHRGIVNRLQWMQQEYQLGARDRVLQKTPYSFDVSVWEFFWPLMSGATLVIARPEGHRDSSYLADLIAAESITVLHFVPSMLRLFLEEPGLERCRNLRRVICSGEALPIDAVDRFFACLPGVRLANLYGPTEAAVDVTFWECRPDDPRRIIPIGRPIANTRMYVLDDAQRPVAIGEVGELYIGGVQVGLGYVARPELTAERFLQDPFVADGRLYRTGDLGRWLDDGAIEYLGRADQQVKVRGNRIELGEIESLLLTHPQVLRCVVNAHAFDAADVRLVAYVVAAGDCPGLNALRAHLAQRLPDYMLPQHVVALQEIPLLPNGKTNRKALPAPDTDAPPYVAAAAASPVAAETPPQDDPVQIVARCMAEVLRRSRVEPHQHFFELGGHSLLAAKLSARLNEVLGVRPGLRTIFEAATPNALAVALFGPKAASNISTPLEPIPRRADGTTAPLSMMQQRLWFLEQLSPGTIVHNVPSAHRLRGDFNRPAFERALQQLLQRQDVLRTVIESDASGDRQRVLASVELLLPWSDLSALPRDQAEAALQAYIAEQLVAPFDLARGPLFRMALFRMAPEEHVFFFMAHHLIWDGWSFDLLYSDLAALYDACRQDRPVALPELQVRYGDFAAWHTDWMSGPELARQMAHWRKMLSPLPPPLELPLDRPRPPAMSGRGASHYVHFDRHTLDALHALSARQGNTLFVTLLSVFALLLHRLSQQDDIIIGTPVRARERPELEPVMGFFVNALPLRSRYQPEATLREWMASTRGMVVDAYACPDVPMEHLVRELKIPRDNSRPTLTQALFSFQDVRERPTHWGNLSHERVTIPLHAAAQDLSLWCVETATKLIAVFTFNTDVLEPASAALIAGRFQTLLHEVLARAETQSQPLCKLPLLSPEERTRLELLSQPALQPNPDAECIGNLLAAQARQQPDAIAISAGDERLSYAELEAAANRLARALRERGIQRGALVGLCLQRTPQMLVAVLATLKAGAAYVPLDPTYPRERLKHMARHAQLALLITETAQADVVAWPAAATLLLDQDTSYQTQPAVALPPDPARDASAEDPAYVIYTSGSTGQPKGVVVPHRAVVNFLRSMAVEPGLKPSDTLVAVTTLSFDIAVLELLLPLYCGARVELATRESAADGAALRRVLEHTRATVMQATPTTWRLLIDAGWRGSPRFRALVGGEPLAPDLAQALLKRAGSVWNLYGPTETTVWSTLWRVENPSAGIRIGLPIRNTQVHVLDRYRQPCPIGVPGEIWIGGDGVSLGYLHQPELSAERFISDPFQTGELAAGRNARLYRTGDRGRWCHDGQLEHLGRLDFQVKLRGFRIEPGEIEACLLTHEAVSNCVVMLREDSPADPQLVAYVVGTQGRTPNDAFVRAHLRDHLPGYMLPQHIVALESLPLLPNGKINRHALPAPAAQTNATPSIDPCQLDPREALLVALCRELVGHASVGPDDNFFDVGGHSLLALRLLTRIEAQTGVRLNLLNLANNSLQALANELPATATTSPAPEQVSRGGWRGRLSRLFGLQGSPS
ncbi:MAG: amino acid adenylation domain-containing protein [Rhodanobacteraceae bacterium]|nr:amino acid adenylation domain-containing protein [Rhodanobacteraceae bacterium]